MPTRFGPVGAPVPRCLGAALLLAACGTDFDLPPASLPVSEQEITLYAISVTPVNTYSAYDMFRLGTVRLDQTQNFDFAFEVAPDSQLGVGTTGQLVAALLPRAVLGFTPDGGLQTTLVPWDSILEAPESGYDRERPQVIVLGQVVLATSRLESCNFGFIRARYAKLRVLELDLTARRVKLHVIIDPNCGYRGLGPGVPRR